MAYVMNGRVDQKRRTRDALVAAARDLVAAGETPTVEDAAAAARVSRTTAYRYFPSQSALLAAAHPEIETTSLLGDDAPADVEQRLAIVMDAFTKMVVRTEAQQRTMLRLSLEPSSPPLLLRQGRAIGWIEEALAPLAAEWAAEEIRSLTLALRATSGIEARVWLRDVAGLSNAAATELTLWMARAMLQGAMTERPPAMPVKMRE